MQTDWIYRGEKKLDMLLPNIVNQRKVIHRDSNIVQRIFTKNTMLDRFSHKEK